MNSGMYAALSGALSAQRRLEVISNNLANAGTPGFKADRIQFESVLARVKVPGVLEPVFSNESFSTDFSSGSLHQTDNTLDLALDGEGFFVVSTPEGTAYTRQGNFRRSGSGKLVTAEGHEVQGSNGPITLSGSRVQVSSSGVVTVDGNTAGTISQVDFPKPYAFSKQGNGLFVPSDPRAVPTASRAGVKQGFVEGSNVNVIAEIADDRDQPLFRVVRQGRQELR